MKAEVSERFGLHKGRPRPAYTPKNIHCASCGSGLTLKDEASQLVVCEYCGSHLEVSREQLKVLGKGPEQQWDFPIALGDSFRHKGMRYEVVARLASIEDNDLTELTREYYLFNPFRGSMWLSEYKGNYSLSETTHVMPQGNPFTCQRGEVVTTHDGQAWVTEETGVYSLRWVDGALPWVARVGDAVHYAEFSEKSGSGRQYEAQSSGDEVEYGIGRRVPVTAVRRALGKAELPDAQVKLEDAATKRQGFFSVMKLFAAAALVNAVLWMLCLSSGSKVLEQRFAAAELTGETFSEPFAVAADNHVIKVAASAPSLDNAWLAMDIAVVKGQDEVTHLLEAELDYYHGVEGGESWSEGSRTKSTYVKIPEAGTYRLLLHAVSAAGSTSSAETCAHGVRVRVFDGVKMPHFHFVAMIVCLVGLVGTIIAYSAWKKQGEED